jgi:ubiquinone/menaquinone biosynthesis C-methylase UbiE
MMLNRMKGYYKTTLAAENLVKCYNAAPPGVQQFLAEEIRFALSKINENDLVLDLGCGYGRVMHPLAGKAAFVTGIDTSPGSLALAQKFLNPFNNYLLVEMNAASLKFPDSSFDKVLCLQNGISAFHEEPETLIREGIRVTKPGGLVLFSSYSDKFWDYRLEWFRVQSEAGLIGEIDYEKTGDGIIVCKDGFHATTFRPSQFLELAAGLGVEATIHEVDESSVFCEIAK